MPPLPGSVLTTAADESEVEEPAPGSRENAAVVAECRASGRLFEDADFPASAASINFDGDVQCLWMRPKQLDSRAEFIKDGFSRSDVSQGALGNCWFLASLAGLAERPSLISKVVLPGQSMRDGYCGAFRFRLRRFGCGFVDVIVDDRLPVGVDGPLYAQAPNGEFWVCLLEKALAKLCGCYEALKSGLIFEALADMTGGVCEEIKLPDRANHSVRLLQSHLARCLDKSCVVGASSVSNNPGDYFKYYEMVNGLIHSHSYTLTGTTKVQAKSVLDGRWRTVELVRLRNPWGTTEWQGRWSDSYKGWSDEQKRAVGLVSRDDGEFWMEMDDFVQYFRSVVILHVPVGWEKSASAGDWRCSDFRAAWVKGQTAGGRPYYTDTHCNNPQFVVELTDWASGDDGMATCLVSLEEPDQRHLRPQERQYARKAVFVYEADHLDDCIDRRSHAVADSCQLTPSRTHVHTFRLRPGRYIFLPCTFDPDQEAEFLLRVFTEA